MFRCFGVSVDGENKICDGLKKTEPYEYKHDAQASGYLYVTHLLALRARIVGQYSLMAFPNGATLTIRCEPFNA